MTDQSAKKPPQPRGFVINIIYNGVTKPLRIQPSDTVQAVLQAAIELFPVTEQRHLLALFDASGNEITNESQTAKQAGLKKGSRLVLRQSVVKGG
jgi:hypothetical protein